MPQRFMPSLEHHSDSELFSTIAAQPEGASREMEEIYQRHVRYLFGVVRKQCVMLRFTDTETEDVVHDTFQRAFVGAATYRASESTDPDAARRWTRAWLGRIARNLIVDALGKERELPAGDALERVADRGPPSSRPPSPRLHALQRAISELSEREQDVLRVSALYYRNGGGQERLPNHVSLELSRRWNTSNDNIRAIRKRALQKLQHRTERLLAEDGVES
jgi:RNA polymerase sigma factor (sigma-70 family)